MVESCYFMLHLFFVRICATSVRVSTGAEAGCGGVQRGGGADGGADAKRARPSLAAAVGSKHRERDLPQDTRGNISTTSNSDHEVWRELGEDLLGRLLAQLVDLWGCAGVSVNRAHARCQ